MTLTLWRDGHIGGLDVNVVTKIIFEPCGDKVPLNSGYSTSISQGETTEVVATTVFCVTLHLHSHVAFTGVSSDMGSIFQAPLLLPSPQYTSYLTECLLFHDSFLHS